MWEIEPFKIRCSAIHNIIAEPKKGQLVSTGAATYCKDWLKSKLYGKHKSVTSKYLEKGIEKEDEAIDLICKTYDLGMLFKNEARFDDDLVTGIPDIVYNDVVRDIKCSWDCFTFPLFESKLDKKYYWQVMGYMRQTGAKAAHVDYCLVNTPESLVDKEVAVASYNGDLTHFKEMEIRGHHDYSEVPLHLRVKTFKVDRNQEDIDKITSSVLNCRKYIEELKTALPL